MAPEHPNARIARGLWEAASRGDVDELLRLYAPDVLLFMHADGPYPPVTKGAYAVLDETATVADSVDEMRLELGPGVARGPQACPAGHLPDS